MRIFPSSRIATPMVVACAFFMQSLDSTIVTTALPRMAISFHTDPAWLSLAVTSYVLSLATFVPLSGWLADRFGARMIFGGSVVIFTVASMGCGWSGSLAELVLGRTIQGFGAAMMVPVGRLALLRTFSKAELMRVMTFVSVPALLGPAIGPPLGGLIVTYASWRWIFFMNLPIGALGLLLVSSFSRDISVGKLAPFDIRGFVLMSASLLAWMVGIETIGRGFLGIPMTLGCLAAGGAGFVMYVLHARTTATPIIDLSLLRIQTLYAATIGGSCFRMAFGAIPFLLPIMFQVGFGLSPLLSGGLTFASAAGALLMRASVTRIVRAFGFRRAMIVHIWLSSAFCASCGLFHPDTPLLVIILLLLVGGFFRALLFTAANTLAFADVTSSQMSRATSFAGMMQQLSTGQGVALGALMLHTTMALRGAQTLQPEDFWPAFLAVGVVALCGLFFFLPLPPDAGAEVSGHVPQRRTPGKHGDPTTP